jgi:hypothetical protein
MKTKQYPDVRFSGALVYGGPFRKSRAGCASLSQPLALGIHTVRMPD